MDRLCEEVVHARCQRLLFEGSLGIRFAATYVGDSVLVEQDAVLENVSYLCRDLRPVHLGHAIVE